MEVVHHGASVIVTCDKPGVIEKEIDLRELTIEEIDAYDILEKVIGTMFKQGADKFKLICPDKKSANIIRKFLQKGKANLYEEPDMKIDNTVIIHSPMTFFDEESLTNINNSIIKLIYRSFDELVDNLKKEAFTEEVRDELIERDRVINDKADICRRIINKNVINYRSTTMYNFVDKLEKIGDIVKYMMPYVYTHQKTVLENVTILEKLRDYFYMLFIANKNFTIKKLDEFYRAREEAKKEIKKCNDTELHYYCRHIHSVVKDAFSDLMVKNL